MKKSLLFQVLVLSGLSLVLGLANNLRPDARIEWFRDWPPYASLAEKPDPKTSAPTPGESQNTTPDTQTAPTLDPAKVAELVTSNQGVTDIDLDTAKAIFDHAADFTFWIDARDATLYDKGHISGAHLLHLYEKNDYLPEVEALIQEQQPVALVVYCKGKDCTDSHHLAQDLAAMGYPNIFVYKGGFEEWYSAGNPIEGELADDPDMPTADAEPAAEDSAKAAAIAELVTTNQGVTDIDLDQAKGVFDHAADYTFWIDARDADLYAKGHIAGAELLHLYEKNDYLPEVEAKIQEQQPVALVVYCKGKDCTDSHHLAQDLAAMGYPNIFVYKGGFEEWYTAGYPIAGDLAQEAPAATDTAASAAKAAPRVMPDEKPPGMYLEHVLRDLIPFAFGLILLLAWRRTADSKAAVIAASVFVGLFFIYAAVPKLDNPFLFAKSIWNYDIAPAAMINLSALWMPAVELLAGLALILGVYRRGAGFIVTGLLAIFIVAVSYNVLRGHEFNCGCTSTVTYLTDVYLPGWNDKLLLILRDLGLMVMGAMAVRYKGKTD